jgi:hypothetical protein
MGRHANPRRILSLLMPSTSRNGAISRLYVGEPADGRWLTSHGTNGKLWSGAMNHEYGQRSKRQTPTVTAPANERAEAPAPDAGSTPKLHPELAACLEQSTLGAAFESLAELAARRGRAVVSPWRGSRGNSLAPALSVPQLNPEDVVLAMELLERRVMHNPAELTAANAGSRLTLLLFFVRNTLHGSQMKYL